MQLPPGHPEKNSPVPPGSGPPGPAGYTGEVKGHDHPTGQDSPGPGLSLRELARRTTDPSLNDLLTQAESFYALTGAVQHDVDVWTDRLTAAMAGYSRDS